MRMPEHLQLRLEENSFDRAVWLIARILLGLAVLSFLLMALPAFAQAAAAPPAPSGVTVTLPAFSWAEVVLTVLAMLFALWMKLGQARAHAALQAIVNNPASTPAAKAAATVGDKLETLVESAVGHALPLAEEAAAKGENVGNVTRDAANDLVDSLSDGVKGEVATHFGQGGAALVDLVEGLIKKRIADAQAAKVAAASSAGAAAAAAASSSGPAAVAAVNG